VENLSCAEKGASRTEITDGEGDHPTRTGEKMLMLLLAGCADLVWQDACEGSGDRDQSRFDVSLSVTELLCVDARADVDAEGMSATVGDGESFCTAERIETWIDVVAECPLTVEEVTVDIWGADCDDLGCDDARVIRSLELALR
jgi:hypothetical protein